MALEDLRGALEELFQPQLAHFPASELVLDSARLCVQSLLGNKESSRFFYVARQPGTAESLRILHGYAEDIREALHRDFLWLARRRPGGGHTAWPMRRPELLEGYTCRGQVYLAVSERTFVTGEAGKLRLVDLHELGHLPRPGTSHQIGRTRESWGCSSEDVIAFVDEHFRRHTHRQQVDIFQDDVQNYLLYGAGGRFVKAWPPPPPVPTIRLDKSAPIGRSSSPDLC